MKTHYKKNIVPLFFLFELFSSYTSAFVLRDLCIRFFPLKRRNVLLQFKCNRQKRVCTHHPTQVISQLSLYEYSSFFFESDKNNFQFPISLISQSKLPNKDKEILSIVKKSIQNYRTDYKIQIETILTKSLLQRTVWTQRVSPCISDKKSSKIYEV